MVHDRLNEITWGGVKSSTLNLLVEKEITYKTSARDITEYEVFGVDGNVIVDNERDKNIDMTIPFTMYNEKGVSMSKMSSDIGNWIRSVSGWGYLERSDDEGFYYECYHMDEIDYAKQLQFLGKTDITFKSKPYKYYKDGSVEHNVQKDVGINNLGNKESEPRFIIKGNGDGNLIVNGKKHLLHGIDSEIIIDSLGKITIEKGKEASLKAKFKEYPTLKLKENKISWDGGITSVSLIPRWRDRV